MSAPSLRLLDTVPSKGHRGEIYSVAYASDCAFVLSAGWDGDLHLWETTAGTEVSSLHLGQRSLSACAFGPKNRTLLAGSIEGLFSTWDTASHELRTNYMAHIRPISSIRFSRDGQLLVTTSWDKQVALRRVGDERQPKVLYGHGDIVAGSAFSADGQLLLTWAYDGSVILWDIVAREKIWMPDRHRDRVQGGALSPDGRWAATASRDGDVRLWDLATQTAAGSVKVHGDVRGCWFLLDAESLVAVTAAGWLVVLAIPKLNVRAELVTRLKVECGEVAPSGCQVALGCADGRVYLANIAGLDEVPLLVTATERIEQRQTAFDRLLGKTRPARILHYSCPICQHPAQVSDLPAQPLPCPQCRQLLRIHSQVRQLQLQ